MSSNPFRDVSHVLSQCRQEASAEELENLDPAICSRRTEMGMPCSGSQWADGILETSYSDNSAQNDSGYASARCIKPVHCICARAGYDCDSSSA
jgi:hypothetical protein